MISTEKVFGRIYRILKGMNQRCKDRNNPAFPNYGGRGITIYWKWDMELLGAWVACENFSRWAMCNGYSHKLTIDRIDPNQGYFPKNCRWTTMAGQARTKRKPKTSKFTGVYWYASPSKWIAVAWLDTKKIKRIGQFDNEFEAACAYDDCVRELGLERTLNFETQDDREKARSEYKAPKIEDLPKPKITRVQTRKYIGVTWHSSHSRWRSRIRVNGKRYELGDFESDVDAAIAYDAVAGPLGRPINFPNDQPE